MLVQCHSLPSHKAEKKKKKEKKKKENVFKLVGDQDTYFFRLFLSRFLLLRAELVGLSQAEPLVLMRSMAYVTNRLASSRKNRGAFIARTLNFRKTFTEPPLDLPLKAYCSRPQRLLKTVERRLKFFLVRLYQPVMVMVGHCPLLGFYSIDQDRWARVSPHLQVWAPTDCQASPSLPSWEDQSASSTALPC
jgi:hypothetical protein